MRIGVLVSMLLLSFGCFAQTGFEPGFIITKSGDTLRVYLQEELKEALLLHVKYKQEPASTAVVTAAPEDIRGFGYNKGNVYKAISFAGLETDSTQVRTYFGNLLVKGNYSLYSLNKGEINYYVVQDETQSYFLSNTTYTVTGEINKEGNYLFQLNILANTCDKGLKNIDQVAYNDRQLSQFIINLNRCIEPAKQSESFYHKTKTTSDFIVFAGALPLEKTGQYTAEAIWRIHYPQISRNFSVNIGFHFSNTIKFSNDLTYYNIPSSTTTRYEIMEVPMTMQYNLTHGIIQPYLGLGLSVAYYDEHSFSFAGNSDYNRVNLGVIFEAGIEARIYKGLMAKAAWRYEFILQYPAIGLAYKF